MKKHLFQYKLEKCETFSNFSRINSINSLIKKKMKNNLKAIFVIGSKGSGKTYMINKIYKNSDFNFVDYKKFEDFISNGDNLPIVLNNEITKKLKITSSNVEGENVIEIQNQRFKELSNNKFYNLLNNMKPMIFETSDNTNVIKNAKILKALGYNVYCISLSCNTGTITHRNYTEKKYTRDEIIDSYNENFSTVKQYNFFKPNFEFINTSISEHVITPPEEYIYDIPNEFNKNENSFINKIVTSKNVNYLHECSFKANEIKNISTYLNK